MKIFKLSRPQVNVNANDAELQLQKPTFFN